MENEMETWLYGVCRESIANKILLPPSPLKLESFCLMRTWEHGSPERMHDSVQ